MQTDLTWKENSCIQLKTKLHESKSVYMREILRRRKVERSESAAERERKKNIEHTLDGVYLFYAWFSTITIHRQIWSQKIERQAYKNKQIGV